MTGGGLLRVVAGTISRFHTFDLARELARRGHLAAIYTGFPRWRLRNTGVPPELIRSAPWIETPFAAVQRYGVLPRRLYRLLDFRAHNSVDRAIARTMPDCHVLTVLSGSGLHAGRAAKARNVAYVCDRGSAHIVYQDRLLRDEYARLGRVFPGIDRRMMDKEVAEYAEADAITVPSGFVARSFTEMGVDAAKVHVIPYGVALDVYRRVCPRHAEFRVLFVGNQAIQKGLHDLLAGFARAKLGDARLVLVGGLGADASALMRRFGAERVDLVGPLPREGVVREMSRAHAMVLPSIQEGMARVMAEAMACGCPVIASTNTGGEDIITEGLEGFIVPIRDPDAIADRLTRLHDDPALLARMSEAALARVRSVGGWADYADRSLTLFHRLARARGHDVAMPRMRGDAG